MTHQYYHFLDFQLSESHADLRRNGTVIPITEKLFRLLLLLLKNAPNTVSKTEIFGHVWHQRVVTEGVLSQVVSRLRLLLEDNDGQIVRNVHGVGFRIGVLVTIQTITGAHVPEETQFDIAKLEKRLKSRPMWALQQPISIGNQQIWLASHRHTGERRVFKFAYNTREYDALKREVAISRIMREANRYQFVCESTDADFSERPFFIEMPYFEGGNLVTWIQQHAKISLAEKLAILSKVARALSQCHQLGVIHGDLKPTNILLSSIDSSAHPVLSDFGASILQDPGRLAGLGASGARVVTQNTALETTLLYAAPELLRGQAPNCASDVYALGVTAFQLLSGEFDRPFTPGWESEVAEPLLESDISRLCQANPDKRPRDLEEIAWGWENISERKAQILRDNAIQEMLAAAEERARRFSEQRLLDQERIAHLTTRRRILRWSLFGAGLGVLLLSAAAFRLQVALDESKASRALAEIQSKTALRERKRAEMTQSIVLGTLFADVNPYEGGRRDVDAAYVVAHIGESLIKEMPEDAFVITDITSRISATLNSIGEWQTSEKLLEMALRSPALNDIQRGLLTTQLADALRLQGRILDARPHYLKFSRSGDPVVLVQALLGVAQCELKRGDFVSAQNYLGLLEQQMVHDKLAASARNAYWSLRGAAALQLGDLDGARDWYQKIQSEVERGGKNPVRSGARGLAQVLAAQRRWDEAIDTQRKVVDEMAVQMPDSAPLLVAQLELAELLFQSGAKGEAEAITARILGADDGIALTDQWTAWRLLSRIQRANGQERQATQSHARGLALLIRAVGDDAPIVSAAKQH